MVVYEKEALVHCNGVFFIPLKIISFTWKPIFRQDKEIPKSNNEHFFSIFFFFFFFFLENVWLGIT